MVFPVVSDFEHNSEGHLVTSACITGTCLQPRSQKPSSEVALMHWEAGNGWRRETAIYQCYNGDSSILNIYPPENLLFQSRNSTTNIR